MNNTWKDNAGSHPSKGSRIIPFDRRCLSEADLPQPAESDKGQNPPCRQIKPVKCTFVSSCKKGKETKVSFNSLSSAELLWWKASFIAGERNFQQKARVCWCWQRLCPVQAHRAQSSLSLPLPPLSFFFLNICAFYGHFNQTPDGWFQSGDLRCSRDNNPLC